MSIEGFLAYVWKNTIGSIEHCWEQLELDLSYGSTPGI